MTAELYNATQIAAAHGCAKRSVEIRLKTVTPARLEPHAGHPIRWYSLPSLPEDYRNALLIQSIEQSHPAPVDAATAIAPAETPPTPALPRMAGEGAIVAVTADPLADLTQAQRDVHGAIKRIVEFVRGYSASVPTALKFLNAEHAAATLTPALRWAYEHCWEKKRANSQLTVSTYNKWKKRFKARGHYAPAVRQQDMSVKPWHPLAIELRRRPQGSQLTWIAEQVEKEWTAAWGKKPLDVYGVVYRFFDDKLSQMDQIKGRYTGSQLRSHKFYQHRTAEGLAPADMIHADGWNTHFTAPHPVTGEFVTYEVWHFHDVATRYVPQPGIGLTENAEVIAKGLENCVRELGVMIHLQTDSTKVVKGADRFTKAMHSLEERLGFTWIHPKEVGNSQANGIAENFNTSYLDKRSRELATYQNKNSMDDLSYKRVKKLTAARVKAENAGDMALRLAANKEIARMGKGLVFDSYDQAREWINRIFKEYNDRPHRSLPKISDPQTGRKRHQTPNEALAEHRANGWEATLLDEAEMIDAFRPHVMLKVTRETVSPYGGMRYMNKEVLGHWNGKQVIVAYDLHDYNQVWVKDLKGALICTAEFVAATRYGAISAQEAGDEKRTKATLRRIEKKRETVLARNPGVVIEGEAEKELTILDFIDSTAIKVKPEKELSFLDFLPEEQEKERESTYADTLMWLENEEEKGNTREEVAAR